MRDPYAVLNVMRSSSDEEIKQSYRSLVKKYHPDNYAGSPLADLAGEKMAEINSAYDAIQSERRGNDFFNSEYHNRPEGFGNSYGQTPPASGNFNDVRRLLSSRHVLEAEEILNGTPPQLRDAEWHFLKGTALYYRGFLDDSLEYFQSAVRMDPSNTEYQYMLQTAVQQQRFAYGNPAAPIACGVCSPCNLCTAIVCADCTCSACRCCCGG